MLFARSLTASGDRKAADAEGTAEALPFIRMVASPGRSHGHVPFPGAPSGPVCAVGMTGITEHTALSAMLLPPFPTYIMGLLGHREECLPVRQRGDVPLCHPTDARLCGSLCVSAEVPRGARVRRKTAILFLIFRALFPGIGAGVRPGTDKVHELRAHAFCLHSSLPELPRDPGGSGSGHDVRLCLFSVGCQLPGSPIPCCPFWAASF